MLPEPHWSRSPVAWLVPERTDLAQRRLPHRRTRGAHSPASNHRGLLSSGRSPTATPASTSARPRARVRGRASLLGASLGRRRLTTAPAGADRCQGHGGERRGRQQACQHRPPDGRLPRRGTGAGQRLCLGLGRSCRRLRRCCGGGGGRRDRRCLCGRRGGCRGRCTSGGRRPGRGGRCAVVMPPAAGAAADTGASTMPPAVTPATWALVTAGPRASTMPPEAVRVVVRVSLTSVTVRAAAALEGVTSVVRVMEADSPGQARSRPTSPAGR